MNQSRLPQSLREEASRWWVRLDGGELNAAERQVFESWRGRSPEHRAAFAEICALWGELDGLKPRLSGLAESRPPPAAVCRRKRSGMALALAASLILGLIMVPALMPGADYESAVGEQRMVRLEDGSTVYLGSDSALDVAFGPGQRRLKLRRGEGWFEVAHDAARPFVVEAGKGTTTALGTIFDVKRLNDQVEVTVIENRVAVDYGQKADHAARLTLEAGEQTAYDQASGPSDTHRVDLNAVSAWRRGSLIFENRPLGEVVEELRRYHRGIVLIGDAALRERPVSGVFRTDRPAEALAALENALGLRSTRFTDRLILLHR